MTEIQNNDIVEARLLRAALHAVAQLRGYGRASTLCAVEGA